MSTMPGVDVDPFSGYERKMEKIADDAARALALGRNMPPESVPLIDEDALKRGAAVLRERAPAHFDRRLRAFVGAAVRTYADAVIREIAEDAERIRMLLRGSSGADRKLDAAARANDLATLAFRTYARAAMYMRADKNSNFDKTQDVAKEARTYALSEYAKKAGSGSSDEWHRLAEEGAIARAVLGTEETARIRDALAAGDFTVPKFNGINKVSAVILNRADTDYTFGPPILGGFTYPRVDGDRYGTPRAVARAIVYAVLHTPTGGALLRDSDNPDNSFLNKIKAGEFGIENDDRSRYGNFPMMVLKTHLGGSYGYGGQTMVSAVVPVGDYAIRHVSREDVGSGRAFEDYLDTLTRSHGYTYTYGAKKDAVGKQIGRAKSGGGIKWISPDPFAKG